jgi:glyoxylate utilization-related uncharacterized protein
MPSKAILRTGSDVVAAANDVSAYSPYRAAAHIVPVEGQSPARMASGDMLLFVDRGTVEVMIEGATSFLGAGQFAQIATGHTYAYRNAGSITAHVLIRPIAQEPPAGTGTGVCVRIAAA